MSGNLSVSFIKTIYGIAFLYLLLTPTLHPWYALYLVCLFPFFAEPGGLILSWSVFLSYYVLINYTLLGQWIENDTVAAGIWFASVAGSLLTLFIRTIMPDRLPKLILNSSCRMFVYPEFSCPRPPHEK